MRYALIRKMDISNGDGIGVSLFVQGCHAHCKNCFNPETWSFNGGEEWTNETKEKFFELASKEYVTRISILGGEPFDPENLYDVIDILKEIKDRFPDKSVWLYTGNLIEYVLNCDMKKALPYIDVLVDGKYIDELSDVSLTLYGSTNQRVIDVQKTLKNGDIVLYNK